MGDNFNQTNFEDNFVEIHLLIPENTSEYFRYQGGLTTPTCNPVVRWSVWSDTFKISTDQKNTMLGWSAGHLIGNNRGVQPLAGRDIWRFGPDHDDDHDEHDDEKMLFDDHGHWHAASHPGQCVGEEDGWLALVDCEDDEGGWEWEGRHRIRNAQGCATKIGNKFKIKNCGDAQFDGRQAFSFTESGSLHMLEWRSSKCIKARVNGKLMVGNFCDDKIIHWGH